MDLLTLVCIAYILVTYQQSPGGQKTMTTATTQLTAEEMQKLAQDIIERLKANEGRVCMADTRDLRKIAGTWNN